MCHLLQSLTRCPLVSSGLPIDLCDLQALWIAVLWGVALWMARRTSWMVSNP
ncbi:hypothetical protein BDR07DRAFT_1399922 [Suillus spraguei]|nr:hypothetical protein BDR07DRAFT_1399922 [Suillus spraguei]